ncbi:tetratricopeptide repeat protein [bacterium]|jgi:tetratricopeptide (TPR) repeat protein|nr:tetratricopeptide repeat protein [bacterium]
MSQYEEISGPEGLLPEWPVNLVREFSRESQVDFEINFYRSILEADPNYAEVLRVLASNLAAKSLHEESLEIDQRLVRLRPHDQVALYNLACSFSMVGMIDLSLEYLRRSIDSGYCEFKYMQYDDDLTALRQDPRFHELLIELGITPEPEF